MKHKAIQKLSDFSNHFVNVNKMVALNSSNQYHWNNKTLHFFKNSNEKANS